VRVDLAHEVPAVFRRPRPQGVELVRVKRPLVIAASLPLAAAAGVASASIVTAGAPADLPPLGQEPALAVRDALGAPVADPRGGPPWAVRILDDATGSRCIEVGRVAGTAFGPADAAGRVLDTAPLVTGSCTDRGREPLQVALAQYAATAGDGARSVLFGIADASVAAVEIVTAKSTRKVVLDGSRTFVVIRDGLSGEGSWKVVVTLNDATSRTYRL
jgi:hypothetical protein